jgi:membrane-bound inhibitor of C-type lysozyme
MKDGRQQEHAMLKPTHTLATIILAASLAACGGAPTPTDTIANDASASAAGAAVNATDEAANAGSTITAHYDCKPAMSVAVAYDNSDPGLPKARVTLDGKDYDMVIARSGSGARYATDTGRSAGMTLIWWNKGNDGTLLEGKAGAPASAEETIIATCTGKG